MGTYGPIKTALGGDKDHNSILRNILAGCLSGSFAAAATNPIDLIKTRLQARDSPFKTAASVVRHVVKDQGISGLWNGTTPSVVRPVLNLLTASSRFFMFLGPDRGLAMT